MKWKKKGGEYILNKDILLDCEYIPKCEEMNTVHEGILIGKFIIQNFWSDDKAGGDWFRFNLIQFKFTDDKAGGDWKEPTNMILIKI